MREQPFSFSEKKGSGLSTPHFCAGGAVRPTLTARAHWSFPDTCRSRMATVRNHKRWNGPLLTRSSRLVWRFLGPDLLNAPNSRARAVLKESSLRKNWGGSIVWPRSHTALRLLRYPNSNLPQARVRSRAGDLKSRRNTRTECGVYSDLAAHGDLQ